MKSWEPVTRFQQHIRRLTETQPTAKGSMSVQLLVTCETAALLTGNIMSPKNHYHLILHTLKTFEQVLKLLRMPVPVCVMYAIITLGACHYLCLKALECGSSSVSCSLLAPSLPPCGFCLEDSSCLVRRLVPKWLLFISFVCRLWESKPYPSAVTQIYNKLLKMRCFVFFFS